MTKANIKADLNNIIDLFESEIGENEQLDNAEVLALSNLLAARLSEINNPNNIHYPPTPVQ